LREYTNHCFGVSAIQRQSPAQLRNRNITCSLSRHGKGVRRRTQGRMIRMSHRIETRHITDDRRSRNSRRTCIRRIRKIPRNSFQIRRRRDHELRNELRFVVLLTGNRAIFCDGCAIVIRCVASALAQIAPVGAAVSHVHVKDGDTVAEVVLVEDSCELGVDQGRAAFQARTAP
jgi:hypothetical protein